MKQIVLLLTSFLTMTCKSQDTKQESFSLTISPIIDKSEKTNKAIIETLSDFLKTKNTSLTQNKNWKEAEFQKYIYPYLDIYNIENSKFGKDFYRPTLMDILPTDDPEQKILKIAFIGHSAETQENQLKSIYNIMANITRDKVALSKYLDYATRSWKTVYKGNITYKITPNKIANDTEIDNQQHDIEKICTFFQCSPLDITYYSCVNPKEVFEIKGFDYNPMMYADKTGGLADYGNILFSGKNAEIYTHEIIHIYTSKLFPTIDKFIDEGLATYIAGSGKFNYEWHRKKIAKFLSANENYNFAEHTDPYESTYYENETSIPYLTAALILERTMRLYGKDKLIELLKSESPLWSALKNVGLTQENINVELRKEVQLPITKFPM